VQAVVRGGKEKRATAERVWVVVKGERKSIIQCGLSLKISCTLFSSNGQFKWYTGEGLNRTLTLGNCKIAIKINGFYPKKLILNICYKWYVVINDLVYKKS